MRVSSWIAVITFDISDNLTRLGWQTDMFTACVRNATIPNMITGNCFPYGTQAECEEGELLFLDEMNQCLTKEGLLQTVSILSLQRQKLL